MFSWRPTSLFAALTALILGTAGVAADAANTREKKAPGPAKARKADVKIRLRIIHARRSGRSIDPRIRRIQQKLKRLFKFNSYRMVRQESVILPFGVETRVPTPLRRVAVYLTNRGISGGKIGLKVTVGRKQKLRLKLANGGTFLQGITLKNGQNYILAITAKIP